jgi:hypothetical protein
MHNDLTLLAVYATRKHQTYFAFWKKNEYEKGIEIQTKYKQCVCVCVSVYIYSAN